MTSLGKHRRKVLEVLLALHKELGGRYISRFTIQIPILYIYQLQEEVTEIRSQSYCHRIDISP